MFDEPSLEEQIKGTRFGSWGFFTAGFLFLGITLNELFSPMDKSLVGALKETDKLSEMILLIPLTILMFVCFVALRRGARRMASFYPKPPSG